MLVSILVTEFAVQVRLMLPLCRNLTYVRAAPEVLTFLLEGPLCIHRVIKCLTSVQCLLVNIRCVSCVVWWLSCVVVLCVTLSRVLNSSELGAVVKCLPTCW